MRFLQGNAAMSDADKVAWKAFISKLELEIAKLKADLARYESSSVELRKAPESAPPAEKPGELSRFKQGIAAMEAVIEANRHHTE